MDPSVSSIFVCCNIMLNCSMGYYKCAVTVQDQSWNILYSYIANRISYEGRGDVKKSDGSINRVQGEEEPRG